eukprot:3577864-Pyramimonas_sp.AAC.1
MPCSSKRALSRGSSAALSASVAPSTPRTMNPNHRPSSHVAAPPPPVPEEGGRGMEEEETGEGEGGGGRSFVVSTLRGHRWQGHQHRLRLRVQSSSSRAHP